MDLTCKVNLRPCRWLKYGRYRFNGYSSDSVQEKFGPIVNACIFWNRLFNFACNPMRIADLKSVRLSARTTFWNALSSDVEVPLYLNSQEQ